MKPDNPNAFPTPESEHNYAVEGMSLRDYFAGQALAGLLADGTMNKIANIDPETTSTEDEQLCADMCYSIADAMLAEREKE